MASVYATTFLLFHRCWWLFICDRHAHGDSQVHETVDAWLHLYWSTWHISNWQTRSSVWWPGLSAQIENIVKNCSTCTKDRPELLPFNSTGEASCWLLWTCSKLSLIETKLWINCDATASFPRYNVWTTSKEIPYWWPVTTQIWVVLLFGSIFPTRHDQSEALPTSG